MRLVKRAMGVSDMATASGAVVMTWAYVDTHAVDDRVPLTADELEDELRLPEGTIRAMVSVGWARIHDDCTEFPDFEDRVGTVRTRRKKWREVRAANRGSQSKNAESCPKDSVHSVRKTVSTVSERPCGPCPPTEVEIEEEGEKEQPPQSPPTGGGQAGGQGAGILQRFGIGKRRAATLAAKHPPWVIAGVARNVVNRGDAVRDRAGLIVKILSDPDDAEDMARRDPDPTCPPPPEDDE
jgi:hypothetical protein